MPMMTLFWVFAISLLTGFAVLTIFDKTHLLSFVKKKIIIMFHGKEYFL